MSKIDLDKLRDEVHANAVAKGFWDKELSNQHCLMLVITELAEAVEADRKGLRAKLEEFKEITNRNSKFDGWDSVEFREDCFRQWFLKYLKDTVEDELADAFIRLLDLCGARNISLDDEAFDDETIEDFATNYKDNSFTESVFRIVSIISENSLTIGYSSVVLEMLLLEIFGFTKHLNIDLMWYVEQKMKYNQSRERLHGKKY